MAGYRLDAQLSLFTTKEDPVDKFANRFAMLTVGLAVGLAGCANHITEQDLNTAIAGVQADIDDNSERISANEEAIDQLRSDLDALREDLEQLRRDFDAHIEDHGDQLTVALPVHFEFDEANIRPVDEPILDRYAATLRQNLPNDAVVAVEGFADPAGSEAYNRQLSQRRADAVVDYLVDQGVDADILKTANYGETRLVTNEQGPGRAGLENRRVTFVIDFGGNI